jgi:hypothetical protein
MPHGERDGGHKALHSDQPVWFPASRLLRPLLAWPMISKARFAGLPPEEQCIIYVLAKSELTHRDIYKLL